LAFGNANGSTVLSLDTTTRDGSVAVVVNDQILHELRGDPARTHGERLPGDLIRALDLAGLTVDRVDLLAVAAGPGSFTGLRVGIAAMQGLATATGRRIVPVSALDALARAAAVPGTPVAAWMDAQRGQVFAALYDGRRDIVAAPTSLAPAETLTSWSTLLAAAGPVTFVGDGAVRYEATIRAALGLKAMIRQDVPLLAGAVGLIASEHPERAVLPHAVVPIYIRRPDAELARLRQRGRAR
jgi:tRNA threonylcarbamoyladenosine biosynthesis protein TsaB